MTEIRTLKYSFNGFLDGTTYQRTVDLTHLNYEQIKEICLPLTISKTPYIITREDASAGIKIEYHITGVNVTTLARKNNHKPLLTHYEIV